MLAEVLVKSFGEPLRPLPVCGTVNLETQLDKRLEQEGTGASLMVCKVSFELCALIYSLVSRVTRREGTYTPCSDEFLVNRPEYGREEKFINRAVLDPDCIKLVRPHLEMLTCLVNVVGKYAEPLVPELRLEARENAVPDRSPSCDKFCGIFGRELLLHLEGEAYAVVPECVGFHLVAGPFGNGPSIYICIHPGERNSVNPCPEQTFVGHCNLLAHSRQVALEHSPDGAAVFLPNLCRVCSEVIDVLLEHAGKIERGLDLGRAGEETLLLIGDEIVEDFLEKRRAVHTVEGKSRQRLQGFPEQSGVHPGKSGIDSLAVVVVGDELVRIAQKHVVIAVHRTGLCNVGVEPALEGLRILECGRSGKYHRLARLEPALEHARNQQVLATVEAAAEFVRIGNVVVPLRVLAKDGLGIAKLHVQVRKCLVEAVCDTAGDFAAFGVGFGVLMGEAVNVPECEERL